MHLPESLSMRRDLWIPSIHQAESGAKWRSVQGILCLALLVVIAGAFVCPSIESPVLAQNRPAIDPDAMDALNKMGVYLRTLKSFEVRAVERLT